MCKKKLFIGIKCYINFLQSLNIDSKLDGINVDLSTLQILTPDLTSQLEDLKTSAREVKFIPNESLENCKRNFIDFKMKCYNN